MDYSCVEHHPVVFARLSSAHGKIAFLTRRILLELIERVLKPIAINKIADNGSPAISPQILTGFLMFMTKS